MYLFGLPLVPISAAATLRMELTPSVLVGGRGVGVVAVGFGAGALVELGVGFGVGRLVGGEAEEVADT